MKHIRLFESFNAYELPNFRVELIKPGMSSGKWLFTCMDGSWNSFFGVFDLEGLQRLEDAMNTECVFAELYNAIQWNSNKEKNAAFEEFTHIGVNPINPSGKWINLKSRELDISFGFNNSGSNVSDPSSGLTIGEEGIEEENIVHTFSVHVSDKPIKEDANREFVKNYPANLNTLYYSDHHWSVELNTNNFQEAFDEGVGFRKGFLDDVKYKRIDTKDVIPYIPSIIDSGAPKGAIKTLEEMKEIIPQDYPQIKRDPIELAFERDSGFYEVSNEIHKIRSNYGKDYPILGDPGSKERGDSIKKNMEKKAQLIEPLFRKGESILKKWESRLPSEYFKVMMDGLHLLRGSVRTSK